MSAEPGLARSPDATRSEPTAGDPLDWLGSGKQLALWLLITLRLGFGLLAVAAVQLQAPSPATGDWSERVIHGHEPWSLFVSTWQRWDALWYQRVAEVGYHAGEDTLAFSPLYPLLVWLVSKLLNGDVVWGQLIVSGAGFFAAMWLLYDLAHLEAGRSIARLAVLLTAFFPVGFILLAPYTESVFLALTLAAFRLARADHPWLAGLAGFAASLTRTFGLFLVLPLAYECQRQCQVRGKPVGTARFAATLPVLGYGALLAYFRLVVGDRRSIMEIRAPWSTQLAPPWENLSASWQHIVARADFIELLNLVCLLGFLAFAILVFRWLSPAYALYVWPYLLFLSSWSARVSPLAVASRYTLVLFPCVIVLAMMLEARPRLAAAWLVISLLFDGLLFVHWVRWGWVA